MHRVTKDHRVGSCFAGASIATRRARSSDGRGTAATPIGIVLTNCICGVRE
ncbi:Hypothetical protein A7982_04756 [Minicystis rosea]|nr:Hypothetical protein A7982_04756 [Minicystis rosea]